MKSTDNNYETQTPPLPHAYGVQVCSKAGIWLLFHCRGWCHELERTKQKIRSIIFLLLTMLAAVAVWFWAFRPVFTPFLYLRPTGFGPPPSIWYFRLIQPQWVSTPPDYSGWSEMETSVRVAVIVICWIVSIVFVERLYSKRHKEPPKSSKSSEAQP